VGQRVDERHIGAGAELQVLLGLDVRRAHEIDAPRVGDDELRPLTQAALHLRCEHRMTVGGIRTDHEMTSAFITESKFWVPADSPNVF